MGEIYLARLEGAQGFEKLCVIKKILPQLAADTEFVERFVGEARTLVRLSHGSIAQVLDMGLHEDEAYMALEHVDGKDLRKVAARVRDRQVPLPVTFILYTMGRVLDALAYAHRKKDDDGEDLKLVHRDISPQNILISYEGEVKVIDFGLAKSRLSAAKTNPSIILGKFLYMSPEQARHQPVDRRSDLYAVGLCLYELICGKNPFDGVHPGELMSLVANPRIAPLDQVEPLTPPAVTALVAKALAVDPSQRFQTAEEFRGRLQSCLMEIDASAGPESVSRFMRELFSSDFQSERRLLASLKDVPRLSTEEVRALASMPDDPLAPKMAHAMLPAKTIRLDGPVEPLSFFPTPRSRDGGGPVSDGETRPGVPIDESTRPGFPIEELEEEARARGVRQDTAPSVEVEPEAFSRSEAARPGVLPRAPALTREVQMTVMPPEAVPPGVAAARALLPPHLRPTELALPSLGESSETESRPADSTDPKIWAPRSGASSARHEELGAPSIGAPTPAVPPRPPAALANARAVQESGPEPQTGGGSFPRTGVVVMPAVSVPAPAVDAGASQSTASAAHGDSTAPRWSESDDDASFEEEDFEEQAAASDAVGADSEPSVEVASWANDADAPAEDSAELDADVLPASGMTLPRTSATMMAALPAPPAPELEMQHDASSPVDSEAASHAEDFSHGASTDGASQSHSSMSGASQAEGFSRGASTDGAARSPSSMAEASQAEGFPRGSSTDGASRSLSSMAAASQAEGSSRGSLTPSSDDGASRRLSSPGVAAVPQAEGFPSRSLSSQGMPAVPASSGTPSRTASAVIPAAPPPPPGATPSRAVPSIGAASPRSSSGMMAAVSPPSGATPSRSTSSVATPAASQSPRGVPAVPAWTAPHDDAPLADATPAHGGQALSPDEEAAAFSEAEPSAQGDEAEHEAHAAESSADMPVLSTDDVGHEAPVANIADVDTHPRIHRPSRTERNDDTQPRVSHYSDTDPRVTRHDDTHPRVVLDAGLLSDEGSADDDDERSGVSRPKTQSRRARTSSPGMTSAGARRTGSVSAVRPAPAPVEPAEEDDEDEDVRVSIPASEETRRTTMPVRPETRSAERLAKEDTRRTTMPEPPARRGKGPLFAVLTLLLLAVAAGGAFFLGPPELRAQVLSLVTGQTPREGPPPAEPITPTKPALAADGANAKGEPGTGEPSAPPPAGTGSPAQADAKSPGATAPSAPGAEASAPKGTQPPEDDGLDDSFLAPLDAPPGTDTSAKRSVVRKVRAARNRTLTTLEKEWRETNALFNKLNSEHSCVVLGLWCTRYAEVKSEVEAAGTTDDPEALRKVRAMKRYLLQKQKELY
ncbi:Serine/threonine-protein kinase Pkn6 [Myxococcus hansupus]|uniref:Serine/threonine-protein kinase Pkn6 n=1 Tax=Pseudomyxococcus hansupus TaxID=1297742 RepID=A0A0H4WJ88_9BACT|nr:Serine/threonine-protein kinase Pkn6 [Myxococcus hansupus]